MKALLESLEPRQLLSAAPAPWPSAPFVKSSYENTVYVNQKGEATLTGKAISPAGDVDGYILYWDDPGTVEFSASGSALPDLAVYKGTSRPVSVGPDVAGSAQLQTKVKSKQVVYLALRGQSATTTGTYDLKVVGVPHNIIHELPVGPGLNRGSYKTFINEAYDADIYAFTTLGAGDWSVTVDPLANLDATINVYDSAGNPIGGSFTQAINAGGSGVTEQWLGRALPAGTKYYVRVDGRGDSTGWYRATVRRVDRPVVDVKASASTISEGGPARQFTISRSYSTDVPLKVGYVLSGTAKNGVDYKRLSGSVTIPVGHTSAIVRIVPIADRLTEGDEEIVLQLRPSGKYTVGADASASITMTDTRSSPAAASWPKAPFAGVANAGDIYVNQNGDATVRGRIAPPGQFDGYKLFFDDAGPLTVATTGSIPTQVGFYNGPGAIDVQRSSSAPGGASIRARVPADKRPLFLGVRALDSAAEGGYGLAINGPAQSLTEAIKISPLNNAGDSGSDISGDGDFDFYRFTIPKSGNWMVRTIPDKNPRNSNKRLDATMNIYNAAGRPVGGSFLRPINARGIGDIERWTGLDLKAGSTYYLRVDGREQSLGGYGVSVIMADVPRVNIASADATAAEDGLRPGRLSISRSDVSKEPLTVDYSVSGTAIGGEDYVLLSGSVTIPANHASATITITPLADDLVEGAETVTVTLRPSASYWLNSRRKATVTIADRKLS